MTSFARVLRARVERLRRDEAGVTLSELIVTMGLLTMLLAMIMTIFVGFTSAFTDDQSTSNNSSSASVAMNELTRVIRSGTELTQETSDTNLPVFSTATPTKIKMTTYLDTDAVSPRPVQIEFEVKSDKTLVERRWTAIVQPGGYFKFATGHTSERVIARNLDVSGGVVFKFLNAKGTEIAATAGSIPSSFLPTIAAVKVSVTVQRDPSGDATAATIQNTVGIPNLGVSRIGQP